MASVSSSGRAKPAKRRGRPERPQIPLDLNQRYEVPEAAGYLRFAESTIWKLITSGDLPAIRDNGRVFIAGAEIAKRSRPPETSAA